MDELFAFLHPTEIEERVEVFVSDRFKDENGNVKPFIVRALQQEENEAIRRRCTKTKKATGGGTYETLDKTAYSNALILEAVVFPDLKLKAFCDKFGVVDPSLVPAKMLTVGEYSRLVEGIMAASGLDDDVEEKAKN